MSPTAATFLFEAANFLALAGLLGWAFFRPVQAAIERRRAALEAEQREAAEKLADADRRAAALAAQQREFDASLDGLRAGMRRQAEAEAQHIVDAAHAAARQEHEHLRAELATQRRQQVGTAARDAAAAARSVVVQLLERIGGPDLEVALVGAACDELRARAARGVLPPILVETPRGLDDAARARLASAASCTPAALHERVVPELVAGVRVITGAGLIDVSVAGLAGFAERVLLERIDAQERGDG